MRARSSQEIGLFVVLDTSIICRDFLLRGNAFRILLESSRYVPARLCIPEVVLDEALAKYAEALRERSEAAATAEHRLQRILIQPPVAQRDPIDEPNAIKAYEAHLKARLLEAGAKFLPYPKDPHEQVVERALRRQKPFDGKGRGYRDYLIWATLRTEMYYAPEETAVLVTGNTRDFCDGDHLAASLREEVDRFHHPGAKVLVLPSLEAFNDAHVLPRLEQQEGLRAALQAGDGSALDLHAWAGRELLGLLRDEEYITSVTHGLEPEHVRCYVSAIDTIEDLVVEDVRALSPARLLVIASGRVRAVLSLDVDWDQYTRYQESRDLLGYDSEPFSSASWYETAVLLVKFSLVLDEDGSDVRAAEIDSIEGRAGVLEYNVRPGQASGAIA